MCVSTMYLIIFGFFYQNCHSNFKGHQSNLLESITLCRYQKFNNSHQRGKMTNVKVLEEALLSYHQLYTYVNYFRVIKCSSTKWKNNNTLPVHD